MFLYTSFEISQVDFIWLYHDFCQYQVEKRIHSCCTIYNHEITHSLQWSRWGPLVRKKTMSIWLFELQNPLIKLIKVINVIYTYMILSTLVAIWYHNVHILGYCGEYSDNHHAAKANAVIWLVHLQAFWHISLGLFVGWYHEWWLRNMRPCEVIFLYGEWQY